MRRIAALLSVPVLAVLALAGCGSATSSSTPSVSVKGQFGSDPSQTFVLAFDGQLTMDDLEADIKFGERRDKALESGGDA